MPVFIITLQNGNKLKLTADDEADARVKAASRTRTPATTIGVEPVVDVQGRSDEEILAGINLPEATSLTRNAAQDRLSGGRGSINPNTQRVIRTDSPSARPEGANRSFSVAPEEAESGSGIAPSIRITPTGIGPDGGITFGGNRGSGGPEITDDSIFTDPNLVIVSNASGDGGGANPAANVVAGQNGSTDEADGGVPLAPSDADLLDAEGLFPGSAFRSFLRGGGVRPGGIGGSVLRNQENAALNAFAVLNDLQAIPEGTSFTDFLGSGQLGTTRFANQLRGALSNVGGLPDDFEVFGPGGTFTDAAARLARAVQQTSGRSPITAGIFTPSISQVQQRAQDRGFAGQDTNFLDFLRQQFRPQFSAR